MKINGYEIDDNFFKQASKIINSRKKEFDSYNTDKLHGVKILKKLTDGGLKQCKDVCDLYWSGRLPDVQAERREKLQQISKDTFIKNIISKLKTMSDEDLHSSFMVLSYDDLLKIDEII